ncbi:MAG: glucose 1-dehydrogenase [Geminicoccaceae bacterium]|nr:glucose 1-dehydrogenase [Geminicoccaceae bacterium]
MRIAAARAAYGLEGQVAVVTGATSGIGRESALAMGIAGVRVVVNHRPGGEDKAQEVCAEIEAAGGTAMPGCADVSDEKQVDAMFERAVGKFGAVHILLANAGLQRGARFEEMTLADWRMVIDVNLTGQFLCARAAVRHFLARGMQPEISPALGKIIHMSSVHQGIPWAFEVNYAASKGGVMLLMKSLAQEFGDRRIRVNAIAPGAIKTPINTDAWQTDEARAELLKLIPYGRVGETIDIAQTALWLASDLSDYVHGETIFVDGGMMLYPAFRGGG